MNKIRCIYMTMLIILVGCTGAPDLTKTDVTSLKMDLLKGTSTPLVAPPPEVFPTATIEGIKILSREDALARIRRLVKDNGGCELPCIWGISPGRTSFEDAKRLLAPAGELALLSNYGIPNGGADMMYPIGDLEMSIGLWYVNDPAKSTEGQTIYYTVYTMEALEDISVPGNSGVRAVYDSEIYGTETDFYSLKNVLRKMGIPSDVELQTISDYEPAIEGMQQDSLMNLELLYPTAGMMVTYTTNISIENGYVTGCFSSPKIAFNLYGPKARTNESFRAELDPSLNELLSFYLPIDQATNYSNETFFDHYSQSTDRCIKTSAKLWPRPN